MLDVVNQGEISVKQCHQRGSARGQQKGRLMQEPCRRTSYKAQKKKSKNKNKKKTKKKMGNERVGKVPMRMIFLPKKLGTIASNSNTVAIKSMNIIPLHCIVIVQ